MPESFYEIHVMGNPQLPFIFRTEFLSHTHGVPNWHKNVEIIYCTQGSGIVKCNTTVHRVKQGDILAINSEILHSFGTEERFAYHCLIIDRSFCLSNGVPVEQLRFRERFVDRDITRSMEQIARIYPNEPGDYLKILEIRHLVLGILFRLCQAHVLDCAPVQSTPSEKRVREAMTYIHQNLSQPLTLEDIAAHTGISKFYLSREFKALTGTTIFAFTNLTRCNQAKQLIVDGMRVSAAAAACGFENLSYFTRTFKKYMGVLPSSFSERNSSQ